MIRIADLLNLPYFPTLSPCRFFPVLLLLPLVLFVPGCGKTGPKAIVSGRVTLKGQPVSGTISFVGADNKEASGSILPDGSYTVNNPPLGDDSILVKSLPGATNVAPKASALPPEARAKMKEMQMPNSDSPAGVIPPARYGKSGNGLTFKVTGGKQTFDIELKP